MENTHTNAPHSGQHHVNSNNFDMSEIIWAGWDKFKMYWTTLLLALFAYFVASLPLSILDGIWNTRLYQTEMYLPEGAEAEIARQIWAAGTSETVLYVLFSALSLVWSIIIGYNLFKSYFQIYDGHKYTFGEMFIIPKGEEVKKVVNYILTCVLYGVAVLVGFVFLIIPGIYLAVKYGFAMYIAVDKNLPIMENFKLSAKMTEGIKWKLIGFGFVQVGIVLGLVVAGLICLLVGVVPAFFIAIGWMVFMDIVLLRKLYHGNL